MDSPPTVCEKSSASGILKFVREKMYVVKRDGGQEIVHFDKITSRLKKLSYELNSEHCDPVFVSQKVCAALPLAVSMPTLARMSLEYLS